MAKLTGAAGDFAQSLRDGKPGPEMERAFRRLRRRSFAKWALVGVAGCVVGAGLMYVLTRSPTTSNPTTSTIQVTKKQDPPQKELPLVQPVQQPVKKLSPEEESRLQVASAPFIDAAAFKWRVNLRKQCQRGQDLVCGSKRELKFSANRIKISYNEISREDVVQEETTTDSYSNPSTIKEDKVKLTKWLSWVTIDKETGEEKPNGSGKTQLTEGIYTPNARLFTNVGFFNIDADEFDPDPAQKPIRQGKKYNSSYTAIKLDVLPATCLTHSNCQIPITIIVNAGVIKAIHVDRLLWSFDSGIGERLPNVFYPSGWSEEEQQSEPALFRVPKTDNMIFRENGMLKVLDLQTGKVVWAKGVSRNAILYLVPSTTKVMILEDAGVSAIEVKTGELKWSYKFNDPFKPKILGFEQGNVIISIRNPTYDFSISPAPAIAPDEAILNIAIDPNTWQVKWKFPPGKITNSPSPRIIGQDPYIIYLATDSELVAYMVPQSQGKSEKVEKP